MTMVAAVIIIIIITTVIVITSVFCNPQSSVSEKKSPTSKTEDVIMCCLVRGIAHRRGR
jgi:hypothetical protein